MDDIITSKFYRPGSIGYIPKSGDISNKFNNILSLVTNGTYEGVRVAQAIDADHYPGSTFTDHLLWLLVLGEVGGVEEYRVIDAVKHDHIKKKPIVAQAIGACACMFATEVQFGHAGSMANRTVRCMMHEARSIDDAVYHCADSEFQLIALDSAQCPWVAPFSRKFTESEFSMVPIKC